MTGKQVNIPVPLYDAMGGRRDENAKNDGEKEDWHDCFPSVGDITILSDIVDGMLQIWVEKHFFINGKVIKVAQQAF